MGSIFRRMHDVWQQRRQIIYLFSFSFHRKQQIVFFYVVKYSAFGVLLFSNTFPLKAAEQSFLGLPLHTAKNKASRKKQITYFQIYYKSPILIIARSSRNEYLLEYLPLSQYDMKKVDVPFCGFFNF